MKAPIRCLAARYGRTKTVNLCLAMLATKGRLRTWGAQHEALDEHIYVSYFARVALGSGFFQVLQKVTANDVNAVWRFEQSMS